MVTGENGPNGAPAVKPVEKEQKPEQGNVTLQLQWMVDSPVLESVPKKRHASVKNVQVHYIFLWDYFEV